jgi:hypothetical protein
MGHGGVWWKENEWMEKCVRRTSFLRFSFTGHLSHDQPMCFCCVAEFIYLKTHGNKNETGDNF